MNSIQRKKTVLTTSNAKAAFQQLPEEFAVRIVFSPQLKNNYRTNLQILTCVIQAKVFMLCPLYSIFVTKFWQFALTFAVVPYICRAVPIRPVSHRTQRMKLPRIIIPGTRERLAARTRMRTRKARARAEDVTMNGKTLCRVLVRLSGMERVWVMGDGYVHTKGSRVTFGLVLP